MDKIIQSAKEREDRGRHYFLPRIRSYTQSIKNAFDTLMMFIDRYETQRTPANWNIVLTHCRSSFDQIPKLGEVVKNDFDHIYDLIENQYLWDKYWDVNVFLSQMAFGWVISTNPESSELSELKHTIGEQMSKLDMTLASIDNEMPKDEK